MIACDYCRRRNKEESEYCESCGAPLPILVVKERFVNLEGYPPVMPTGCIVYDPHVTTGNAFTSRMTGTGFYGTK